MSARSYGGQRLASSSSSFAPAGGDPVKIPRPAALDLFCGAGGAARGLQRAGFFVLGVDIKPQPRYAGDLFVRGDALNPPVRIEDFDFAWASPPCQRYSRATLVYGRDALLRHPDYLPRVRDTLLAARVPCWVIENVPSAPMRADVVLTGAQFGLLIVRERWFECHGFTPLFALASEWGEKSVTGGDLACVAGRGANAGNWKRRYRRWADMPAALRARLSARNSVAGWREAMQMPWATRDEIREAVPPAYAEFIGRAAIAEVQRRRAA